MAQKQFTTYQADILSFELREAMLGIAQPGRYQGYTYMASNGTPSGGLIPVRFSHGVTGFKKASHAVPPVLGSAIGVAITTQGTIIHEDQNIDKSIGVNATGNTRWDILYMEHVYIDSVGGNPATYGIQQGTAGAGKPALSNPEKRVILGYILVSGNATQFSDLNYLPKVSTELFGDTNLIAKLFGSNMAAAMETITIPSGGVLGLRTYDEQNYVVNQESLSASINKLDKILKTKSDAISALQVKKLDDMAEPDDNFDLNANFARHGLMPKLNNNSTTYMNGMGVWGTPVGRKWSIRSAPTDVDFDLDQMSLVEATWYTLDLSSIVASDADAVIIRFHGYSSNSNSITMFIQSNDDTGISRWFYLYPQASVLIPHEIVMRMDSSKRIRIRVHGVANLGTLHLVVIGYQTAMY